MKKTILTAMLVLCLAGIGLADVVDPELCTATIDPAAEGASIFSLPNGAGEPFTSAFAPGGASVDATITLTVISTQGTPIVGYPLEDMWLESSASGLVFCPGGTCADAAVVDVWNVTESNHRNQKGHDQGQKMSLSVSIVKSSDKSSLSSSSSAGIIVSFVPSAKGTL